MVLIVDKSSSVGVSAVATGCGVLYCFLLLLYPHISSMDFFRTKQNSATHTSWDRIDSGFILVEKRSNYINPKRF